MVRFGARRAVFEGGRLISTERVDDPTLFSVSDGPGPVQPGPVAPADADELTVVAAWLDRNAHRIRIDHVDGTLASPLPALPDLRSR